jgi:hypothetical protein
MRRPGHVIGTGAACLGLAAAVAGCGSHHFTGHSGTCTYGLGAGVSGNDCYSRPKPSRALLAQVDTPGPLTHGLLAWKHSGGAGTVTSVGVDPWAETTFAEGRGSDEKDVTFDAGGDPTHGDDGYVTSPHDPFPVNAVSPAVYVRLARRLRDGDPSSQVERAVISVNPFAHVLTWRLTVASSRTDSHILYEATADGREVCHARDYAPKDVLRPVPGIPACEKGVVLPF